ncbi:MAG: hypothetical protein NkDv07_0294 [Candidatus Improbicoccus devescovinae]|nr:MAG: hypothetical protein NkDv07_0294 [Candidatus Improbicoccus devescovinae]
MRNKKTTSKILAIILLVFGFFWLGANRIAAVARTGPGIMRLDVPPDLGALGMSVTATANRTWLISPVIYYGRPNGTMLEWVRLLYRNQRNDEGDPPGTPVVLYAPDQEYGHRSQQIGVVHETQNHRPSEVTGFVTDSLTWQDPNVHSMCTVWFFDERGRQWAVRPGDPSMPNGNSNTIIVVRRAPGGVERMPSA